MTETPAENKGFLSKLLGDINVNTQVGVTTSDLTKIGVAIFVFASLIFLAWFTFKKVFK